jgi:histidine ammonia-lyase
VLSPCRARAAHLALGMIGEGQMWNPSSGAYEDAADVIREFGLTPVTMGPKEGLALINGTQFISALTAEAVVRAEMLAKQADIIAAVTMEAVRATPVPFEHRIHVARGQVSVV